MAVGDECGRVCMIRERERDWAAYLGCKAFRTVTEQDIFHRRRSPEVGALPSTSQARC